MYNYLVIFFSIFFLLSGCSFFHQDVQNGTKIEPEINIKAAKGDLSVFHLLKENWIKKANLDGLPNELSPDGKWVPVYDSKTGIADYLITTNSPSRTLPIQKISNLWQKSWLYWSPDGKSFAIIAGDISTVPWGDRVLIYHLVNEKLLSPKIYPLPFNLFTDQKLKNIAWAPDSTQLALLSEGPNKLYFIDQNANPIKELNVDNLQDNSDFALE